MVTQDRVNGDLPIQSPPPPPPPPPRNAKMEFFWQFDYPILDLVPQRLSASIWHFTNTSLLLLL